MAEEEPEKLPHIGEMEKRREKMADAKRYIIYYTFGSETASETEKTADGEPEKNV